MTQYQIARAQGAGASAVAHLQSAAADGRGAGVSVVGREHADARAALAECARTADSAADGRRARGVGEAHAGRGAGQVQGAACCAQVAVGADGQGATCVDGGAAGEGAAVACECQGACAGLCEATGSRKHGSIGLRFSGVEDQVSAAGDRHVGGQEFWRGCICCRTAVAELNCATVDIKLGGAEFVVEEEPARPVDIDGGGIGQTKTTLTVLSKNQGRETAIEQGSAAGGGRQIQIDIGVVGIEQTVDSVGGASAGAECIGGSYVADWVAAKVYRPAAQAAREVKGSVVPSTKA